MSALPFRLPEGGRVDRSRPVSFTLDGRQMSGLQGDTLASALLANGVTLVGRSFKYHRPRGLMSAGIEEPNGLFTLGEDGRTEPNIPGTAVELASVAGLGVLLMWHLARRGRLIRDRLGPPRPTDLPEPAGDDQIEDRS